MKYPCDEIPACLVAPAAVPVERASEGWILAVTILGSSLAFIDGTAVNVALPSLQLSLQTSISGAQWVVESYALFLASLLLVGGNLGDLFGRRLIFAIGVLLFAAASAWCGFAPNVEHLILARAVQGIGGALLVPGSLAIISASFSPDERGKAIGTWSGFTGITAAVGPVLGGWLVQHLSWRWVFFINLPIAAAVLMILFTRVPESRAESARRQLDLPGAILITGGLGSVVFAMIEAPNYGWANPKVWGTLAASAALIAGFLAVERRARSPLLPLELFRIRNFTGANLLTLFLYAALGAALFFLPFNLIQTQGYTPTQAGAANLPFIVILFLLSRWSGGLVTRYGPRLPLVVGSVVTGGGFLLLGRPGIGGSYWSTFFPAMAVLGLGMAGVVAPLTTTVMNSLGREQAGVASGVNNAVSRAASLLAIAVFGIVALHGFSAGLRRNVPAISVSDSAKTHVYEQRNRLTQIELPRDIQPEQAGELKQAIGLSFVSAFRWVMLLSALLAMVSAASAWTMIGAGRQEKLTAD